MTDLLFQPVELNSELTLSNKIVMAPLTRCMSDDNLVPTDAMVDYYAKRADSGLIITEATIIRPDGQGYPNTPGIFTQPQIAGWKKVTDAVHDKGGKIFSQLWHTGRVAHSHFYGGGDVIAPSPVQAEGTVPRMRELVYQLPKEATAQDIAQLIEDYAKAAENAVEAGFDGVEIHAANGYLIDQFLHYHTNQRTDEYGGSAENMCRFPLAVIDAVIARIGKAKTAVRISPGAYFNMEGDARDREVFDLLLAEIDQRDVTYLHVGVFDHSMQFDYLQGTAQDYIRANYKGVLMGVGGYTATTGSKAIANNEFDLLAIGRPFIANPDYISKVKSGEAVVEYSDDMLATLI